jgi:hypothetical protein
MSGGFPKWANIVAKTPFCVDSPTRTSDTGRCVRVSGQVDGVFGRCVPSLWRRVVSFSSLHRRVREQSRPVVSLRFPILMRTTSGNAMNGSSAAAW